MALFMSNGVIFEKQFVFSKTYNSTDHFYCRLFYAKK